MLLYYSSSPKLTPTPSASERSTSSPTSQDTAATTLSAALGEHQAMSTCASTGEFINSPRLRKRRARDISNAPQTLDPAHFSPAKRTKISSDDTLQLRPQRRVFYNSHLRSCRKTGVIKSTDKTISKRALGIGSSARRIIRVHVDR